MSTDKDWMEKHIIFENGIYVVYDEAGLELGGFEFRDDAVAALLAHATELNKEKEDALLTPEEMKAIDFLARRMNTEIDGLGSVTFWPFPIILKVSEEIQRLDAEIVSLKHHWKNHMEEYERVKARIDKLEALCQSLNEEMEDKQ